MGKKLYGSICLSDIPKDKITTSEKNGKKYLNVNVWLNDEPDQYGNDCSVQVQQSKEEQGQKAVYIGNLRFSKPKDAPAATAAAPADDLPF